MSVRDLCLVEPWLTIIGAVSANPVPRGLSTRRRGRRSGVPLVRTPRTLPKVLDPGEVNARLGALRRWRDRAMVEAMVLGGLRRCEVLGLRLEDLRPAERRVFISAGTGGHQRLVPISGRFLASVARYLDAERPPEATTDRVFVVLQGPRRGRPLSADGLDEIVRAARARAGLAHATCHELRTSVPGYRSTGRRAAHVEISRPPPFSRPTVGRDGRQPAPGQPLARPKRGTDHRGRLWPPLPRDQRPDHRSPRQGTTSRSPPAHREREPVRDRG
jgi:integrase